MSLGVKLTIGSWIALIVAAIIYSVGIGMLAIDSSGMILVLVGGLSGLVWLASIGLGLAGCVLLCQEKSFDTLKMVIAIVVFLLCCGPFVPLALIFIPAQEG